MTFNWEKLLKELNDAMLAMEDEDGRIDPSRRASGWLGNPPATEEQVTALENRIGRRLPDSYRTFLRVTNGWSNLSPFIYELWPAERICWLVDFDPLFAKSGSISAMDCQPDYESVPRFPDGTHLIDCLALSAYDDGIVLLNPRIQTADGEWEAWFMANWVPGEEAYASFWELMEKTLKSNLDLRNPPALGDLAPPPTAPPTVTGSTDTADEGVKDPVHELRKSMSYMVAPTIGSLIYEKDDLARLREVLKILYMTEVKERHMAKLRELASEYPDTALAIAIEEFLENYPKIKYTLDDQP